MVRSSSEWTTVEPVERRRGDVIATLVADPAPNGSFTRATARVDGRRLEVVAFGGAARRLAGLEAGQRLTATGVVSPPTDDRRRRLALRHVVGTLTIERISSVDPTWSSAAHLAAHRVRSSVADGAAGLDEARRALLLGLLLGADAGQGREVRDRFRESGLAHLTAVSGQNVAFVLTLLAPMLRRLPRWTRLSVTVLALGWFATATRFEPSVVRATSMAVVAALGAATWRRITGREALAGAMVLSLAVDPFLLWSVGWWLSVSGCVGLLAIAPRLDFRSRAGRMLVAPALGAQVAVLPVSVLVFGVPSALSVPCNLLVAPVAGVVMLVGLPVCLAASFVPEWLASVATTPVGWGVWWIDSVAAFGAAVRPPPPIDATVAVVVAAFAVRRIRSTRTRVAD